MDQNTQQQPKKSNRWVWIIGIVAVLMIIGKLFPNEDSGGDSQPAAPAPVETVQPSAVVSAAQLLHDYDANEISADNNYKGKVITVNGVINDIGNDLMNDAYVTMGNPNSLNQVQAMIKDKNIVAKLQKGQAISVTGKCSGKMMNVLIRDCTVR